MRAAQPKETALPKRPKPTPAQTTRAFASAYPKHPQQDEFLEAAIALRADELVQYATAPTSRTEASAQAMAEFDAALQAVIYPPPDRRFLFIWNAGPEAKRLAHHVTTAWHQSGEYGERRPQHWTSKK